MAVKGRSVKPDVAKGKRGQSRGVRKCAYGRKGRWDGKGMKV